MKIRGVDYFFYNVSDIKKSLAFYRDVMGLEVTDEQEKWAEFDCGNLTLGIGVFGADPKAAKNGAAVALSVDNVEDVVAELKGKKVKIVTEPMDFPDMCEMAIIADPDGNQIILHHRKDGSVG
ncbi:MAG: VOC family protein [Patescibacteria group bacterium]|nr:VOC family protein [Patescibacteria group bacterium]